MKNTPRATYRVQLRPGFGFDASAGIVDYLHALGVSHFYAAPMFASCKGSEHGYDVVNMNAINEELGGAQGFDRLSEQLSARHMGYIQDIVPNHRAFNKDNPMLMDVLENGPASTYYNFFDIFWDHPYENINGRVLAPFLGDFYGRVLERGELRLGIDHTGFRVHYYDQSFPIRPECYDEILSLNLPKLKLRLGAHNKSLVRFIGILRFLANIEVEREYNKDFNTAAHIKELLWQLYTDNQAIRDHIDTNLAELNGKPGEPDSFQELHRILSNQYYRLSYWKVGTEELNYRRFFSINDLICLRVEDEQVFRQTHQMLFDLARAGKIHGVRVDHLDGLYNPTEYVQRLREAMPDGYIVVEKILEHGEDLPEVWPIEGTTGYDFLTMANGVFCARHNEEEFDLVYRNFTHLEPSYDELVDEKKRDIVGKHMAGDIDNLALMLKELVNRQRFGGDLTLYSIRRALVEILTQYSVYRTYATEGALSAQDREIINRSIADCRESFPILTNELDLIHAYMLQEPDLELTDDEKEGWNRFLMRLQQYTSPLMAKGVEDTVFFVYNRLVSLNEVGGSPERFGATLEDFHAFNAMRASKWPAAMSATGTHDTKRGEDARARITVLSEIPEVWQSCLDRWSELNEHARIRLGRRKAPSRNDEYTLYQTILGSMPFEGLEADDFPERLRAYMIKACREAKICTSWLSPREGYEQAINDFIDALLNDAPENAFRNDFLKFAAWIQGYGVMNSLGQTLLKVASPGVPDIYQGSELWDFSLVDPDNRRPVDFQRRREMLERIQSVRDEDRANLVKEMAAHPQDGLIKLYILHRGLEARNQRQEAFQSPVYQPLDVEGPLAGNVIAFSRGGSKETAVAIATRWLTQHVESGVMPLPDNLWQGSRLAMPPVSGGVLVNVYTGRRIEATSGVDLAEIMGGLPVALLISE